MAHERRREWAEAIAAELGGAPIAFDQDAGEWDTASRALRLAARSKPSWTVVIQDDAILAPDFRRAADALLTSLTPEHPVSFYLGNLPKHQHPGGGVADCVALAREIGASWIEMPGPWWAVGFAVPTVHVSGILERASASNETDRRIQIFYKLREVECRYTFPSIVDHRRADVNPSINGSPRDRFALEFIGDRSALELDAGGPVARMHTRFRSDRNGRIKVVRPRNLAEHDRDPVWTRL